MSYCDFIYVYGRKFRASWEYGERYTACCGGCYLKGIKIIFCDEIVALLEVFYNGIMETDYRKCFTLARELFSFVRIGRLLGT